MSITVKEMKILVNREVIKIVFTMNNFEDGISTINIFDNTTDKIFQSKNNYPITEDHYIHFEGSNFKQILHEAFPFLINVPTYEVEIMLVAEFEDMFKEYSDLEILTHEQNDEYEWTKYQAQRYISKVKSNIVDRDLSYAEIVEGLECDELCIRTNYILANYENHTAHERKLALALFKVERALK